MIRVNIPGFTSNPGGDGRMGDAQIIDDGTNYLVIDGYCGSAADALVNRLKTLKVKAPYLLLTHPHYDHYNGIRKIIADSYFSPKVLYCYDPSTLKDGLSNSEIKSDYNTLVKIVKEAKAKGIAVKYVKHGDRIVIGDIDFYVYRRQPAYQGKSEDPHGWAFVNDGSLACWFHTIGYWTSGDGPEKIYDLCKSVGAKPVFFKIPHHGNNCPASQANGMKNAGALYCWDNSYNTNASDDFLKYGRRRCIEAGIKYIDIHGDINFIAQKGYVTIYKDFKTYKYKCSYKGKARLKQPNLHVVMDVLRGHYGTNNTRITGLMDDGFYPIATQKKVTEIVKLIKG